jgi:uncharacterized protein involved in exopolysaccharide biosynthesis
MVNENGSNGERSNGNGHARFRAPIKAEERGVLSDASLRDVSRTVFRHKGKIACFAILVLFASTVYGFFLPKTYRSEAKLFVRLGRENVGLDATTTLGNNAAVAIPPSREEEINTVVEVLRSRSLLERIVDDLGPAAILSAVPKQAGLKDARVAADSVPSGGWLSFLRHPLSTREKATLELKKHLNVEAFKKTNIIFISHEGPSPEISQQIVAKLIDCYLDEHVRMNRTAGARSFLTEQAGALKEQLGTLENELCALKNATGLASPTEQRQILVNQIGHLEDESKMTLALLAATEAETAALGTRIAGLHDTRVLTATAGHANVAADGMRQQLYTLQIREQELASRVTDEHVELKLVRQQISQARAILNDQEPTRTQIATGPDRAHEELNLTKLREESTLASLRAKEKVLTTQLADARHQLQTLNKDEVRIGRLQRDVQMREADYRKYAAGLEQARIDDSLERERISNINVAETPTLNHQPVRPQGVLALILGCGAAVCGGLVIAFAAEYFDHSLKTPDEVESRLGVPVLVSIPTLSSTQIRFRHARSTFRG